MNTLYYILHYVIYQALLRGICFQMNEINAFFREEDPDITLVVSLHRTEHPLTQLWLQINKEQLKLTASYAAEQREYEQS